MEARRDVKIIYWMRNNFILALETSIDYTVSRYFN